MILLTVGTQIPFDRLVRAVDAWCAESGRSDVVGQIGNVGDNCYRPKNFEWNAFVPPSVLADHLRLADFIIAHAGMGSIISALRYSKPIVIMPRRASLGEHRNDHQLATAARFEKRPGIYLAHDASELPKMIDRAMTQTTSAVNAISAFAEPSLIRSLRDYIFNGVTTVDPSDLEDGDESASLV